MAMIVAAALGVEVVATTRQASGLVVAFVACGVVVLGLGLVARAGDGVAAGTVLLFAAYLSSLLFGGRALDVWAPLVAAGLVLVVELGSWSLELADATEERAFAHLRQVVVVAAAAAGVTGFVVLVGSARPGSSVLFLLFGAAAAVALAGLISSSARQR